MKPADPLQQEREERISELQRRLEASNPVGVKAPVALAAMVGAVVMLVIDRRDVGYEFSPRSPIRLGAEGDYHLDGLRSNRYAEIHGTPTLRGTYGRDKEHTFLLIGLRDTPVVVRRNANPAERWIPGTTPPQPDQRPFGVRGRLLSQEDAPAYADGFAKLAAIGELHPKSGRMWILIEGEKPGSDARTLAFTGGLGGFFLLNAWFLWRAIHSRARSTHGKTDI